MRLPISAIALLIGSGTIIVTFIKSSSTTNPTPPAPTYEQKVKSETRALVDAIPYRCLRAAPYDSAKGAARFDILGMRLYMSAGEIVVSANATQLFNRELDSANSQRCLSEEISKSDKKEITRRY